MKTIFNTKSCLNKNDFFIFLPKSYQIVPITHNNICDFDDLKEISEQKEVLLKNTLNFTNNVLLWGAKGMGKSTLVKSVIKKVNKKAKKKYKLIEILNNNIGELTEIVYELSKINSKFIIFIDDISLNTNENSFMYFKSLIEGSLLSQIPNIRYYVTSNLRHLSHREKKLEYNDIEEKEASQNLISLSDRFGSWIGFYDSNQEQYLNMVKHYLKKESIKYSKELERQAIQWSIEKGNFSGRSSYQFVKKLKNKL